MARSNWANSQPERAALSQRSDACRTRPGRPSKTSIGMARAASAHSGKIPLYPSATSSVAPVSSGTVSTTSGPTSTRLPCSGEPRASRRSWPESAAAGANCGNTRATVRPCCSNQSIAPRNQTLSSAATLRVPSGCAGPPTAKASATGSSSSRSSSKPAKTCGNRADATGGRRSLCHDSISGGTSRHSALAGGNCAVNARPCCCSAWFSSHSR